MNNKFIPLAIPEVSGNEWKYVKECLDIGWVSSVGSYVNRFEDDFRNYVGAKYAVAVINGTSALHLSLLAAGVQPDDEVIVPTLTFIAPVNAVAYCGAKPVFMDCEPETLSIDPTKLKDFLERECEMRKGNSLHNKQTGRRIKAIIPVHIFGHPGKMDAISQLSNRFNLTLIEDATESLGSEYQGRKTGTFGLTGCFSFNGNKIITTGGGGMVVTDDEAIAKRIRHLSTQAKCDGIEYDHNEIGYNYRLTNVLAALGVAQLERLDEFLNIKRTNAQRYRNLLNDIPGIEFQKEPQNAKSNWWFYAITVASEVKNPLMECLIARNIQVRPIWKLIHGLPMYKECQAYRIENAHQAYETCLNLPCSVNLTEADIIHVVNEIRNFRKNQRSS